MEKTSRFNYIKKGIVGVCAATMLTGLCAGTAFADDATKADDSGTMTSAIAVDTQKIGQISVTVPTAPMKAIATVDGEMVFGEYVFTNNSPLSVQVTKMVFTKEDSINLVKEAGNTSNEMLISATFAEGAAAVNLADCTEENNTTSLPGVSAINKGAEGKISLTGQLSNVTKDIINEDLSIGTVVWTLAAV